MTWRYFSGQFSLKHWWVNQLSRKAAVNLYHAQKRSIWGPYVVISFEMSQQNKSKFFFSSMGSAQACWWAKGPIFCWFHQAEIEAPKSMFDKIDIMQASAELHLLKDLIYAYLWGHQSHCLLMAEICMFITKDLSVENVFRETIHCRRSIGHIKVWSTKAWRIILRLSLLFVVK